MTYALRDPRNGMKKGKEKTLPTLNGNARSLSKEIEIPILKFVGFV